MIILSLELLQYILACSDTQLPSAQLHFGMPGRFLSVVCGKQREMKRTSHEKSDILKFLVRTGAGGDPDAAAIPVEDDDMARKLTWDLAKYLYFLLQNTLIHKTKIAVIQGVNSYNPNAIFCLLHSSYILGKFLYFSSFKSHKK